MPTVFVRYGSTSQHRPQDRDLGRKWEWVYIGTPWQYKGDDS